MTREETEQYAMVVARVLARNQQSWASIAHVLEPGVTTPAEETVALEKAIRALRAFGPMLEALGDVPICNREFGYESFCALPKGHGGGCRSTWRGADALALARKETV